MHKSLNGLVFFLYVLQSNVRPHAGSGIMAKPRSVMICQASLSRASTNNPRISGLGTPNHQPMPIGHASSCDTDLINFSVFPYVLFSQLSLRSLAFLVFTISSVSFLPSSFRFSPLPTGTPSSSRSAAVSCSSACIASRHSFFPLFFHKAFITFQESHHTPYSLCRPSHSLMPIAVGLPKHLSICFANLDPW